MLLPGVTAPGLRAVAGLPGVVIFPEVVIFPGVVAVLGKPLPGLVGIFVLPWLWLMLRLGFAPLPLAAFMARVRRGLDIPARIKPSPKMI